MTPNEMRLGRGCPRGACSEADMNEAENNDRSAQGTSE